MIEVETYSLNLARGYVKEWGVKEGLREIIANAYDESGALLDYEDGKAIISNDGTLEWKHLTLGTSEKKENAIGQFGEGLKVGALALVRAGRKVTALSDNLSVVFEMKDLHGVEVLFATEIVGNAQPGRTVVIVEPITYDEYDEAKALFVPYAHEDILWPRTNKAPVKVYMRGVLVQELKEEGYCDINFADRSIVNRDRSVLDMSKIKTLAANIIANQGDPSFWFSKLISKEDIFEKGLYWGYSSSLTSKAREKWERELEVKKNTVNGKLCYCDPYADANVVNKLIDNGWGVAKVPYSFANLLNGLGVSSVIEAVIIEQNEMIEKGSDVIPLKFLSSDEKNMYEFLLKTAQEHFEFDGTEFIIVKDNDNFVGLSRDHKIYLTRQVLSKPILEAISVVVEECIHHSTLAGDLTRSFQHEACMLVAKIIMGHKNETKNS